MWNVGEKRWQDGSFFWGVFARCIAIAATLALATQASHAIEVAGEVVSVEGTVFVRPDGRAPASLLEPVKPGDLVRSGDVINSSSDGKIKILMKDRTIIDLGPSALFKIAQFKGNEGSNREVEVNMVYGSVRAAVAQKLQGKGKFKLRTPSAVMGVRGTEFIVKTDAPTDLKQMSAAIANPEKPVVLPGAAEAQGSQTQVTVVQGRVDVEPKAADAPRGLEKPVILTQGTQLTTQVGEAAPAQAVKVDAAAMTQIRDSVKVADNTFQKAVAIEPVASNGSAGGGAVARSVVTSAVSGAVAMAPSMSVSTAGFAGTFGANQTFTPVNQNFLQAGMLRTISVQVIAP